MPISLPTTLVPAAKIEGELVYESKDILLALEKHFPEVPLLPSDPEERAIADRWVEESETTPVKVTFSEIETNESRIGLSNESRIGL